MIFRIKSGKEYQYELLLDGISGEILSTVMEKTPYSAGGMYYSRSHFTLDDRALDLVEVGKTNDYDLLENGKSILPEGKLVERYSMVYIGDNLWFYVNDFADVSGGEQEMFVVRPDGKDEIKILPFFEVYTGNNAYLFFSEVSSNEMWCFDIETGESWTLEMDQDLTLYSVTSDGSYVYSCELVYDENGKPAAMRLVDKNIRE